MTNKGLSKITDSLQRLRYVARRKFKSKTRLVRTDRGPDEWMNFEMDALMEELRCKHQTAATGRHQQNGGAEKAIRDNKDIMRCSLHGSGLTQYLKDECRNHAARKENCMPCMSLQISLGDAPWNKAGFEQTSSIWRSLGGAIHPSCTH